MSIALVPAGRIVADTTRVDAAQARILPPVRPQPGVSGQVTLAGLRQLHAPRKTRLRALNGFAAPAAFAAMLRGLFRSDWVVYAKTPVRGPSTRSAISAALHARGRDLPITA